MPKPISESFIALTEASADPGTGLLDVVFLSEGWGSSGYYSRDVVESAAPLFAAGTHMYFDHPTDVETMERPGRSVRDLCAVIKEAGVFDPQVGGVRGKVKPFAPYRELLLDEDFAANIGLSIRGSASDIKPGEAEGRRGKLIEGLAHLTSVDFVTRAGRGGKVLQVLESAAMDLANGLGLDEATVNDTREALQNALRDAYGGDKSYVWVRDFDQTTVWFEVESETETGVYGQTYTSSDDDTAAVELTGDRTEVRVHTQYVPVTRPDSTTTTATESQEDTMPKIQIEESEHTRLTETAGRVDELLKENATLKAEKQAREEADAAAARTTRARAIVAERATEAKVEFTALEVAGLTANLPLKEGALDEAAFTAAVEEAAADRKKQLAESRPGVVGFGASAAGGEVTESTRPSANPWGRDLTVKGA